MFRNIFVAAVAIAISMTFAAEYADAFGGRGYARRQVRRAHHHVHHAHVAPLVVHRAYVAPVYRAPVVRYHSAPAYYHRPVSVHVGRTYGAGYPYYGGYGSGVSVNVGW